MLWIRRHRRAGLFVFILLAVLALGGIGAFLYSNTSLLRNNEQASKETTTEEITAANTTTSAQPESTTVTAAVPEKTAPVTTAPHVGWVSAIGDSVMLGAVEALQEKIPNLGLLNAQGSRQPSAAIDILQQWRTAGYLGDAVVIDIGNNGPFTSEQFDEMMGVLAGVPKVLIVTLTVPPGVENPVAASNNTVLTEGAQRYPNTVLVDWHAASANHPEYFSGDSTHLSLQGAQAYADLVASHLDQAEGAGTPPGPQETISWGEGGFFGKCVGPHSWCAVTTTP
ncbi:MAG: hypothetical protein JOZ19_01285 [Rubrobacter sp.]|nr:hypothetical protein [Rubrobacter sp.]